MIETLRGSATTPSYLSDTTPRLVRNRPVPDRGRHIALKKPRHLSLKVTPIARSPGGGVEATRLGHVRVVRLLRPPADARPPCTADGGRLAGWRLPASAP